MTARILDGKGLSEIIQNEIKEETRIFTEKTEVKPGLAVVLIGDNPASQTYVRSKSKKSVEVGFYSEVIERPANISQEEAALIIKELNQRRDINGILIQLPLPKHLKESELIELIDPSKDVDGLHPMSVGKLCAGLETFIPCTPYGIKELLIRNKIDTRGKEAVIVGRSNIVGKPMAQLLLQKGEGGDATVTICHSRTKNIEEVTRRADILIAAIGSPLFIKDNMVKPGVVVIDVGINRVENPLSSKGYILVGDVDFEPVKEIASAITPVPGGVGPMTIAMLLKNTLLSAKRAYGFQKSN